MFDAKLHLHTWRQEAHRTGTLPGSWFDTVEAVVLLLTLPMPLLALLPFPVPQFQVRKQMKQANSG